MDLLCVPRASHSVHLYYLYRLSMLRPAAISISSGPYYQSFSNSELYLHSFVRASYISTALRSMSSVPQKNYQSTYGQNMNYTFPTPYKTVLVALEKSALLSSTPSMQFVLLSVLQ